MSRVLSNKELSVRLESLEAQVLALAKRDGKRLDDGETKVNSLDSEMPTKCANDNVSSTWDESANYSAGFYVIDDDKLYKCLIDNYGIKPSTDPIHWELTNVVDELNALNNIVKEIWI